MFNRCCVALVTLLVGLTTTGAATGSAATPRPPVPIRVILPHGYAHSSHRWPVVYDLNTVIGSCHGQTTGDCGAVQAIIDAAASHRFITVFQTNGTGSLSDYIDWADGSRHNEDTYLRLFTWVDAHYRTIPDRLHRALGGVSAGAYGAFTIAAHHPQMFGQIGSISGPLDIRGPGDSLEPVFVATGSAEPTLGAWGVPVVDDESWKAQNPTDLVARYRHMKVWVANGNGVPCDANDGPQANPIGSVIEGGVGIASSDFVRAARAAGVVVSDHPDRCGVHTYRYFEPRTIAWLNSLRFPAGDG